MNRSVPASLLIASAALVSTSSAAVLLQDNFDDNSIDAAKWNVVIPTGSSVGSPSVTEAGSRMELAQRGHLNSASPINPDSYSGGIIITGTWFFGATDDFMQVLTRTDGTPAGQYGETANGVEFYITNGNVVQIRTRNDANIAVTDSGSGTIVRNLNTPYDFTITDGAGDLSFTITERDNAANTVSVSATLGAINPAYTDNLVTFHNREGGNRTSYLDDVTITSIPEPTTSALVLLSLGGLALRRRA
ncbi:PEP-CTERM sorting domain-containing protein [Verrucomicrobiaceae bacterium 227]